MKGFKIILVLVVLVALPATAQAEDSAATCGRNMDEVNAIIEQRFNRSSGFTGAYLGSWLYPGKDPLIITRDKPFQGMGYQVLICPRADRTFVVRFTNGSYIGKLKMNSRNRITLAETALGDYPFDRVGTANARR